MIQNLIVPFIISLLLLFYSYTLSMDNKDIKEKEKRFRHLFNTSSEGLIIHKNGLIIDANSTFEKIFQVKTQDVLTGYCSIWEFLPALESLFDPDNIDYNFNKKNLKSRSKISKQQQQQQFQNQSVESSANSTPRNNNNNINVNSNNNINVNSNNNSLLNVIVGNGNIGHNIINRASRSNTGLSDSGSSLFEETDSVDFFSPCKNQNKSPIVFDTIGIMPCGSEFTAQVKIDRKKFNQQSTSISQQQQQQQSTQQQQQQQQQQPIGQSPLLQVLPQQQQFNNQQIRNTNNNNNCKSNYIQSQYRSYSKNDFDVMSIVDVSARKKLIIADQALRRAEELNQAKINFLTTVSHEVRTPINGILASVEILDGSHLDTTQRDFLTCIKDSADYLLDLITDILDFSKIEAGKMELERIEFNLITMLEESVNIVYRIAQEKKIDVLTIIDPDVPIILIGDPYRVKQIILNFLSNAIKFTTHGQVKVVVSGSLITNYQTSSPSSSSPPINFNGNQHNHNGLNYKLIFSVEDSGVGIKDELIDLLFTPFYQLDGTNRNLGTGLGLSISKKLTALMGGDVGVKSVYGSGSTFSFSSLLSTSTLTPITLKSLSYQLSQSLVKLINGNNNDYGNGNFSLSKINGFIFDDNIQSSNSISNFLNLLDIHLKIVENQKNLKSDLSSFLNQLSTDDDDHGNNDKLNLIITTKLSNENLNYFKEKLNSIINNGNINNNNNTIYWFLLTENGLQTVDSFYSGIIKKPCNITSLVENVFKMFNCQIPIELYQLLTNRTKDDYKNYLRQKKVTPFKKFNLSNIGSIPQQPPSPLLIQEQQFPHPKEINENNTRVKELVRNSSDHIAITRGMIQENRSPRMSNPPLLFNLKGKGHSTNNLSNGSSIDFEPISIGGSSSGVSNSNNSSSSNSNNISAISISIGNFTPRSNTSSPPIINSTNNNSNNSNTVVGLDKDNNNVDQSTPSTSPSTSLPVIKITNNQQTKTTRPTFIPPLDITSTAAIAVSISNCNFGNNFVVDINSLLQDKTNEIGDNNLMFDSISDNNNNTNNNNNNSNSNNNNNTISPNNRSLNNSNAITPPVTPKKRNALIVDDTELNRKVLAQLLRKLEWKVSFASDGFEALKEIYEERCFDIVFMDYSMPILDGFETTKLIRQKESENGWKRLNIVALSADSSSSFGQQCFNAGMDDYMGKPITLLTLKNTLNKWGGYNN